MDKLVEKVLKSYNTVIEELDSIRKRDPAAVSRGEIALLYSGFHAVLNARIA